MTLGEQVVAQMNTQDLEDWQLHLLAVSYQDRIELIKKWAASWHSAQVVESTELTRSFTEKARSYARELAADFAAGTSGRALWTVLANE